MNIDPNDLVGQTFGLLYVESIKGKNKDKRWVYNTRCSCGNTIEVHRSALRSGNTKSCGCLKSLLTRQRGKEKFETNINEGLIGKQFGYLTILEHVCLMHDNDRRHGFICLCKCGKKVTVFQNNLFKKNNPTRSCGCLKSEVTKKRHLEKRNLFNKDEYINKRFGRLIVAKYNKYVYSTGHLFECLCDCGNTCIVSLSNLKGGQQSCGCLSSEKSSEVLIKYLKKIRISKGIDENQPLTNIVELIQESTFDYIKKFILEIDEYTCNYCLKNKKKLHVHHIDPINQFLVINDKATYIKLYDINNLITLCEQCHHQAHNYYNKDIDTNIQNELMAITKMRYIDPKIKKSYEFIVKNTIEPFILNLNTKQLSAV